MTIEIPAEIRSAVEAARKTRGRERKLTDEQIKQVQALREEGESFTTLAEVYGVNAATLATYAKLDLD